MHTEGHDMGKPEGVQAHPSPQIDQEHPGYELQDVNVGGVVTFLAGLAAFVLVFYFFCFFMGKAINYGLAKQDGAAHAWQPQLSETGVTPRGTSRENLKSNATIEQDQLADMANAFPAPRLETDDGESDIAEIHAKEDLLLDNYSTSAGMPAGTVRIPIDRAMELIVERGLPKATAVTTSPLMVGDSVPTLQVPLTNGFARTGYELQTIEARQQKNDYEAAEKSEKK